MSFPGSGALKGLVLGVLALGAAPAVARDFESMGSAAPAPEAALEAAVVVDGAEGTDPALEDPTGGSLSASPGAEDTAGWEDAEPIPDAFPSTWRADPEGPESFRRPLSLTEVELPPVTPGLQALQAQLDALPLDVHPSPATEFGFILTDLAATGLFFGSLGVLTAVDEHEQGLYLLLTAASAVMLPIGAITWAVGEIVDATRRRTLKRRRHQLMRAIDQELAFHPHG